MTYFIICLEVLPSLPEVDAVVTSPPYAEQRKYGGNLRPWDENMRGAFAGLNAADDCQVVARDRKQAA